MSDYKYRTHHGYAVNVKDYGQAAQAAVDAVREALSDAEIEACYERARLDFWEFLAPNAVQEFTFSRPWWPRAGSGYAASFETVYAEGRMGGWCVPHPQPSTDDMYPDQLEEFEREFAELSETIEAEARYAAEDLFLEHLAAAVADKAEEAAERAYWAARDTVTVG